MATTLSPEFVKAFNAMTPDQQAAVRALGVQGKTKTAPTPVGVRIPETPLPPGSTKIGGTIVSPTSATPTPPAGVTQVTKTPEDTSADRNKAAASAAAILRDQGLEELIPEMESYILNGRSFDEFKLGFYDPSTVQGKVVNRIYPEWAQRRAAGNPISLGEIVTYRAQAKQLMRSAGLPEGFYDSPDDFSKFITNDVSLAELQTRIQDGYVAATQAPQDVRDALKSFYGVDDGHLAAYFLDPSKAVPVIQQQFTAAQIGGAGTRSGYGATQMESERLAALGVGGSQAQQGFGQLAASQELFDPLVGDTGGDTISRTDQQAAVFEGNANAAKRISRNRDRAKAQFDGGGAFSQTRDGFSGVGLAN